MSQPADSTSQKDQAQPGSAKVDNAVALGLAQLHRAAYQTRVEQTSKTLYGCLLFFAVASQIPFKHDATGGALTVAIWVTVIFAMVDMRTGGKANEQNMKFVHAIEDDLAKSNCSAEAWSKKPTETPRKEIGSWQQAAIFIGGSMATLALWLRHAYG